MERNENRMTWLIIIGLIVVGGLASAVWPFISAQLNIGNAAELAAAQPEPEPIVINVSDHLLGEELLTLPVIGDFLRDNIDGLVISQSTAVGILVALTVGSLVIVGGPLALIYTRLESSAAEVQEDEEYKAAVSVLEKRQNAELKEQQQASPARVEGDEASDRRSFAYAMAFLGLIFAWIVGLVLGQALFGSQLVEEGGRLISPVARVSLIVFVIAAVGSFVYFRFIRKPEEIDPAETDYAPVSWGWVWVVVSGFLIVGVGLGLAFNLISGGT